MAKFRASTRWITPGTYHTVRYGDNSFLFAHPSFWETHDLPAVRIDGNPRRIGVKGNFNDSVATEMADIFWIHIAPDLEAFNPVDIFSADYILTRSKATEANRQAVSAGYIGIDWS